MATLEMPVNIGYELRGSNVKYFDDLIVCRLSSLFSIRIFEDSELRWDVTIRFSKFIRNTLRYKKMFSGCGKVVNILFQTGDFILIVGGYDFGVHEIVTRVRRITDKI